MKILHLEASVLPSDSEIPKFREPKYFRSEIKRTQNGLLCEASYNLSHDFLELLLPVKPRNRISDLQKILRSFMD